MDLIERLAGSDTALVEDLLRHNEYIRRDLYINAFLIHPLFLEFLTTKQDLLSKELIYETYNIAGLWCNENGFKIDALSYYEKIGNYKAIVDMFIGSATQVPYDIAVYAASIFDRTPLEIFNSVIYLASTHLRSIICQGLL